MTYYSGTISAVPTSNKQSYIKFARDSWPIFQKYGAARMVESWGVDIPKGKVNDLYGAVSAKADEAVVYSWIEWPDKASADAAWQKIQDDPAMQEMAQMPFDGSRMIYGGFESIFEAGTDNSIGYVQGFTLAVPEKNKAAYTAMAKEAWDGAFKPYGCLGTVEAWGVDVPHGKQTDFYRATKAEAGEVPLFSWTIWPDRATCDAAAKSMEASMEGKEFPTMPFDGMRMMWGGFEPIFDSAKN